MQDKIRFALPTPHVQKKVKKDCGMGVIFLGCLIFLGMDVIQHSHTMWSDADTKVGHLSPLETCKAFAASRPTVISDV